MATLSFLLVQQLPEDQLLDWGWRLPFLASVVLIPVGYLIRRKITDSPEFVTSDREGGADGAPFLRVLREHPKAILLGTGSFAAIFGTFYLMTTFVLAYATSVGGLETGVTVSGNLVGATAEGAAIIAGAVWSLRFPARRIAAIGGLTIMVWSLPGYLLIQSGSIGGLYVAVGVALAAAGLSYGVLASEVGQQFPTAVRYSGLSISYALGAIIGGGLLPTAATWLHQSTGSLTPIIVVTALIGLIATISILMLKPHNTAENWGTE